MKNLIFNHDKGLYLFAFDKSGNNLINKKRFLFIVKLQHQTI